MNEWSQNLIIVKVIDLKSSKVNIGLAVKRTNISRKVLVDSLMELTHV